MAEAPATGGQVIDLMEALRASLERKAPAKAPEAEAAEGRKPPKRAQQVGGATKKSAKK